MADTPPPKTRKPISPERKAKLLENLAKARARAAEVRKEKKMMKDAKKKIETPKVPDAAPKVETKVETIPCGSVKVEPIKVDPRDAELERLRNQVKTFTLQDIARKSKPKPKPKKRDDTPPPSPTQVRGGNNEIIQLSQPPTIIEDEPKPEPPAPKMKAKPTPPPPAPSQPEKKLQAKTMMQTPSKIQQTPPTPKPYKAFRKKMQRGY